jgi:hypothetical protein
MIFKRRGGNYECFDSLGYKPDSELKFIPQDFRVSSGQDHTWILQLLKDQESVDYNELPLQKTSRDISTCGRWCALRMKFSNMHIDDFQEWVKDQGIDDDVLCELIPVDQ